MPYLSIAGEKVREKWQLSEGEAAEIEECVNALKNIFFQNRRVFSISGIREMNDVSKEVTQYEANLKQAELNHNKRNILTRKLSEPKIVRAPNDKWRLDRAVVVIKETAEIYAKIDYLCRAHSINTIEVIQKFIQHDIHKSSQESLADYLRAYLHAKSAPAYIGIFRGW